MTYSVSGKSLFEDFYKEELLRGKPQLILRIL